MLDSAGEAAEEQLEWEVEADWEERWVDVLRVRFSQEQIHPFFHRRGPIRDVLGEINNEVAHPAEATMSDSELAPSVRLLPPFEPIRCIIDEGIHGDLISLDNRRLYALQLAAVERWPARCLVRARVANGLEPEGLQWEWRKLGAAGLGPLGRHAGKPPALLEHLCGDVGVLVASRGSAWEPWHAATALPERCSRPRAGSGEDRVVEAGAGSAADARRVCEDALRVAWAAFERERGLHDAIADEASVKAHARAHAELCGALEALRHAAAAAPGLLVLRVGSPGDRDGYISVAARAAALARLGSGGGAGA